MKILIDINHPAHVHYFKNVINNLVKNGYDYIITNRDSEIINKLLDDLNLKHKIRAKRPTKNSFTNSLIYLFKMIFFILKVSSKEKVDIYLGFASAPCSIVSFLRRKPCIVLDDTEHNRINQFIYKNFCKNIITPFYFSKSLTNDQITVNAFIEQLYLHKNHFKTKRIIPEQKTALLRFITYDAKHDSKIIGNNKLNEHQKLRLVNLLESKGYKVFISDESEEPNERFSNYQIKTGISEIHYLLENVDLFISEGATMACEAGLLGTEYFYINPLEVGNINQQVKDFSFAHKGDINDVFNFLETNIRGLNKEKSNEQHKQLIDPTYFLTWYILNYPTSRIKSRGKVIDHSFIEQNVNFKE
tara:strand:+ start:20848 stop:21924 length:1077 start_codon:yes stop_codon:yes gene_type:complete